MRILLDTNNLTEDAIYQYIWFIRESAALIWPYELLAVPMRDPKDILILQTAAAGDAEIICTLDTDFYATRNKGLLYYAWYRGLFGCRTRPKVRTRAR